MIDLAFSPINHRHTMSNSNGSSKFEHAQLMSHNLQTLLFQGSPGRPNPDSSPTFSKNRKQSSGLYPVPNLESNNAHSNNDTIATTNLYSNTIISSPTTSALAADMSQNFHIDKTPVLPTPRRSLFQFSKGTNRSFGLRRAATTTSVLSTIPSSPMAMDMDEDSSPLPHKPVANNTTSTSSFQMNPPSSSLSNLTNNSFPSSTSVKPKPFAMARMKSLSNASFLINSRPQLNPIQFVEQSNARSSTPTTSTTPTLANSSSPEMSINNLFAPSPVAQKTNRSLKCKSAVYIPNPTTRESFGTARQGLTRNSKVRRTHSMFQHPEEFLSDELNEEKQVSSPSDDSQSLLAHQDCSIKTFSVKEDPFRRIERETLCEILDGKYNDVYDRFVVIDCRFEYEYEGGHIDGAININSKNTLEESLLKDVNTNTNEKLLLIFHCEYSAHRGPRMAMHLRKCDRHLNNKNYPRLHYPDIVILQGGYSHFFEQFYNRCVPQRYVEMNDASHAKTCEREMDKFRKNMKFSRAQTYTFGASNTTTTTTTTTFGTPCGNDLGTILSDFRFPLREQDTNTTPTGPPSRKLSKLPSLNDYMDSNMNQTPQFNVCAQLRFA